MMVEKVETPNAPQNNASEDPRVTATELAADVIAGRKTIFEARKFLTSIKHPGERLKVQYEFRQQLASKIGINHGIDKWGDYVASLKNLRSRFVPE